MQFIFDIEGRCWIYKFNIRSRKVGESYRKVIKIPEFVYGIVQEAHLHNKYQKYYLGGKLFNNLSTVDEYQYIAKDTLHLEIDRFDEIVIDADNLPLVGVVDSLFRGINTRMLELKNFSNCVFQSHLDMFAHSYIENLILPDIGEIRYGTGMFNKTQGTVELDLRHLRFFNDLQICGLCKYMPDLKYIKIHKLYIRNQYLQEIAYNCKGLIQLEIDEVIANKVDSVIECLNSPVIKIRALDMVQSDIWEYQKPYIGSSLRCEIGELKISQKSVGIQEVQKVEFKGQREAEENKTLQRLEKTLGKVVYKIKTLEIHMKGDDNKDAK